MGNKLIVLFVALFYVSNCEMNFLSDDEINDFLKYNYTDGSGYDTNTTYSHGFENNKTNSLNITNGYGNNRTESFNTTYEFGNNRTVSSNTTDNSTLSPERDGYKFYPGHGYFKFHHASTWENAKYICEMEDGYLTMIESRAEANFLIEIYNSNPKYNKEQIWLGFFRRHGSFYDVKGNTLGYSEWAPGKSGKYVANSKNCGILRTKDGLLDDDRCDKWLNYICDRN